MSNEGMTISFPEALIGFPGLTTYQLFEPSESYPLKFLQAVDAPEVSFPCMDAATVKMDYEVPLTAEESAALALEAHEDALVLTLVVVPTGDPKQTTANLAGPIVINTRTRTGRQIELDSNEYPLKYLVFSSQVEEEVDFPSGLLGFPHLKRFRLMEPNGGYPLKFLQAMDQEEISFTCIDVPAIKPDFEVELKEEDATFLGIEDLSDALILALVAIPKDPRNMTANLTGPLVVNTKTHKGRQLVLDPTKFPLQFPVFANN